jgi:hypothetical protein
MTIPEMIKLLQKVQTDHGEAVEVYFDCPHCRQSFTPGRVVTKAVVLNAEGKA